MHWQIQGGARDTPFLLGSKFFFITDRIRSVREGYVFTRICLFTGEGVAGGGLAKDGWVFGQRGGQHPLPRIRQDRVNRRSVRILLECVLVFMQFSAKNLQNNRLAHPLW